MRTHCVVSSACLIGLLVVGGSVLAQGDIGIDSYSGGKWGRTGYPLTWHIRENEFKPGSVVLEIKACMINPVSNNLYCSSGWKGLPYKKGNGNLDDLSNVSTVDHWIIMFRNGLSGRMTLSCQSGEAGALTPSVVCSSWHALK